MASSRIETIFFGEAGVDTRKHLIIGVMLFVATAVLSLGFQLLLDGVIASWPRKTGFETVDVGTLSIELSNIFWSIYGGLLILSTTAAFMTAQRDNGLLISVLVGSASIIGYVVGTTIYYGNFTKFGYSIEPIPYYVLYGIIAGMVGFSLSRIQQ